ncbi:MCE family protein [[Mycobacterium] vasticus]|uniref:MCE family protein n=1 Tax=[Mycobacterium] vasticus TaxID=2875777 RepID=A0ABU5YUW2_9MYCO|nr:MlaD family protein [Mycolicibacter sp. MYC017]MEB3068204.1 MCE family protein [Mycolicibacter sp. MYC017]
MLTRFVRLQLIVFAIASVIAMAVMVFVYLQVSTLLGTGRIIVTMDLPGAGGLYRFSNVTYRGSQIGKVIAIEPTAQGARAKLSLDNSPRIPADLQAQVRSVSAIGEQYVELRPRSDSAPFLHDGSLISAHDTTIPQQVGPMLDQLSGLLGSIPKDSLAQLLNETSQGLSGAGYDLGSLIDSSSRVSSDLHSTAEQSRQLIDDTETVLDSQVLTSDSIRSWTRSLAGVSSQLTADDPQIRGLLQRGPGAFQEVTQLFEDVRPTLPILLANLTSVGQIGVTYHPALEQVLVLLPPLTAMFIGAGPHNNYVGQGLGDFRITLGDPSPCTVGYLPPNQWRPPGDTSPAETPDGLYCKLPQDAPVAVRGARNYPCMARPGKRAPTVKECDADSPFEPLAQRQHALGPYPFDPNLIGQGIPPDWRVDQNDHLYAPPEGTPGPPDHELPNALPAPPEDPAITPPSATEVPAPQPVVPPDAPSAQPQAYDTTNPMRPRATAAVAFARYDPGTGKYMAPDGHVYTQRNLVTASHTQTWKELILPG